MTDTTPIHDMRVTRRYFAKFDRITRHLTRVAGIMEADGSLTKDEVAVLGRYLVGLTYTFQALAHKYMFAGRVARAQRLEFDRRDSGFPMAAELLEMAVDASQIDRHLAGSKTVDALKDEMIQKIVGDHQVPTRLQYALSQRLYYEELARGHLFWPRNDPETLWQGTDGDRRRFLVHWAVYDSSINLPTIYLMDLEDTGRTALPKDDRRWPEVQAHLMAQALGELKLLTIARGFDRDFDDLHPKRLRRFHVGPMYSSAFTEQTGPMRAILQEAKAPEGEDWALAWTVEDLVSDRVEPERAGWFGTVEREVFTLDPFAGDSGASDTARAIILPQRPYQVLEEKAPPGFSDVRKFVVSPSDRVLVY
ncbi:MAG: hypothetical protein AAFO93_04115 [Pseudomonadota bacterium]